MANQKNEEQVSRGLAGVVAADSEISLVDGDAGVLIYRGYDIHDIVEHMSFEEATYLVWYGEPPTELQLREFEMELASHRPLSVELMDIIDLIPASAPPMSALRTAVSALGVLDPRAESHQEETNLSLAVRLTAKVGSIVPVLHRRSEGLEPVHPEPQMSFAENFLWMLKGERPGERQADIFDKCLTLHIDHGLNASTFTARVIASTRSDIYSALSGAIAALRGPLHGGANQRAMQMLIEIGRPEQAREHVLGILARKERVMGFGHPVYNTEDPRATHLRRWSEELGELGGDTKWYDMSRIIEETLREEKGLHCNVDFYAASVYYQLGIPLQLYTPIFAVARMVGWTAHILEQYAPGQRIIRPKCRYTGPRGKKLKP